MIALEISVNGERVCLAGAGGTVWCTMHWGRFVTSEGEFQLRIGGREYGEGQGEAGEFCHWPHQVFRLGDEVTVRFIESDTVDPSISGPRPT